VCLCTFLLSSPFSRQGANTLFARDCVCISHPPLSAPPPYDVCLSLSHYSFSYLLSTPRDLLRLLGRIISWEELLRRQKERKGERAKRAPCPAPQQQETRATPV